MLLKAGVDISRLNRNIRRALSVVDAVFLDHNQEPILTSTYEGNHSAGSLHYANDAFDLRLPDDNRLDIVTRIRERLGKDFDVIIEYDHIHIEYDPKP